MKKTPVCLTQTIIFITGTDTGVGKTVLTCLLLAHLRRRGIHALAMKPFLTGAWADARLLAQMQDGELTLSEISPFFFAEPVAPVVAARQNGVPLPAVLEKISALKSRCQVLLVEGIGGLRVPLGPGYTVAELIAAMRPAVVVAAPNQLGVINHAILTGRDLYSIGIQEFTTVLMGRARADLAARSNPEILRAWLRPNPVLEVPWLGPRARVKRVLITGEKKIEKIVARLVGMSRVLIDAGRQERVAKITAKKFDSFGSGSTVQ